MADDRPLRIGIITCAVLEDEIEALVNGCEHVVLVHKLPQGLHNDPPKLRQELQIAIDELEAKHDLDAIALGYGLCSRGTEGVFTKKAKLVLPRAHDCITLLLGSKERYKDYQRRHPGTYWYSPGWNRHHIPPGKLRHDTLRAQYIEKFGEEDADYLMEEEQHWFSTYDRATFVDIGVTPTEPDEQYTQECAKWLGWQYDRQNGDPSLINRLVSGDWNDQDFLVLEPGQTLKMTADDNVVEATDANRP